MKISEAISIAVQNIATHGDTDVFPFPFEMHLFFDMQSQTEQLLANLHDDFETYLANYPPFTLSSLTPVGYTGFRWATQIEPFWNSYYLALVVSLAGEIEAQRLPENDKTIFSYRYGWDLNSRKLFKDSGWRDYRARALELSNESSFVVVTDIADFYPRINHHRVEVALQRLSASGDTARRIVSLLKRFSKNVSYGLPIGGPASRILAELALTAVDAHLARRRIRFCRYADDYCIFCKDKSEAYRALVLLSEKLFNEGLILQKAKTKILSSEEFRQTARLLDPAEIRDPLAAEEQKLLNITIRFDPYSPTAVEDYEALRAAVSEVDVLGILGREIAKSSIDTTVAKQAINAIRALDPRGQSGAIRTLLDPENILVLSPVFVTIMRTVSVLYDDLPAPTREFVDQTLVGLYDQESHLLDVELNLSYFLRALGRARALRKEEILIELFERPTSPLIRRQIILVMASWGCHYWLTDLKQKYASLTDWEKRAVILASYQLGDEGRHWREHTKATWNPMETLIRDWFANRAQVNKSIPL